MKKILYLIAAVIAAIGLTSCGAYNEYIDEVKTGYLGGCFDVTVAEVFEETMSGGKWDGGKTDDGKIIVEYGVKDESLDVAVQFTVTDENHFNVSGISVDGVQSETDAEGAALIESRYTSYYGTKYPDKATIDFMPNEPSMNILQGISAAYAEKAKNPIDIANYFDKSSEEIKSAFGLEEKDGFLKNAEIAVMADAENKRIDTAVISGSRVYSLFTAQTYQMLETALAKIADRFEKTSEQDNGDGTATVMLIRNNSEDSLAIKYDTATTSVTEITYTYNGLEGYRAEQERLKKEAEEKAAAEKAKAELAAKSVVKTASQAISAVKDDFGRQDAIEHFDYWYDDYSEFRAEDNGDYYTVYATFDGGDVTNRRTYKVDKLSGRVSYVTQ